MYNEIFSPLVFRPIPRRMPPPSFMKRISPRGVHRYALPPTLGAG